MNNIEEMTYEIPDYLNKFIKENLKNTYFEKLINSGMVSKISFENYIILKSLYLMKNNNLIIKLDELCITEEYIKINHEFIFNNNLNLKENDELYIRNYGLIDSSNYMKCFNEEIIDSKGNTAFMFCLKQNLDKITLYMINEDINKCLLNAINKKGETALSISISKIKIDILDKILNSNIDCNIGLPDFNNKTPIMNMIEFSYSNKLLIKVLNRTYECNLEHFDNEGNNVFLMCCYYKRYDICFKLLDSPELCDLKKINNYGVTSFSLLCKDFNSINNNENYLNLILLKMLNTPELCNLKHIIKIDEEITMTPLMECIKNRNEQVALKMLDYPELCNLDYINENSITPLILSCYYNNENITLKILNTPHLCNINYFSKIYNKKAIDFAINKNLINIINKINEINQINQINEINQINQIN